jgi:hypothetical protein
MLADDDGRYIGALKVQDLLSSAKYSHVIAIRGNHMVDFKFTSGPATEFADINHQYHLFIQFNSIRWLVSVAFLGRMWRYLMGFVTMMASGSPEAADAASKPPPPTPDPIALPTSHFKYHIKLINPLLTWLENDASSNVIVTDLGEVDVQNALFQTDDENQDMMEEMTVSVKALNAHSGFFADSVVTTRSRVLCPRVMLTNTDVLVAFTRPALNTALLHPDRYAGSKINVNIPAIKFILSPEQLILLFNFFKDNWYYTPAESDIALLRQLNLDYETAEELAKAQAKAKAAASTDATDATPSTASTQPQTTMNLSVDFGSIAIDCRDHIDLHTDVYVFRRFCPSVGVVD